MFRRQRSTTISERELAVLNQARAEVAKMPDVLSRHDGMTTLVTCYSCRRDHRIKRSVHGTFCPCGSTSFHPRGVLDVPVFVGAAQEEAVA